VKESERKRKKEKEREKNKEKKKDLLHENSVGFQRSLKEPLLQLCLHVPPS